MSLKHALALALTALLIAPAAAQQPQPAEIGKVIERGLPGPGHAALKPLEGTWRVEMSVYMVLGTVEKPAVSTDLVTRRQWVADGRYLQDVTEGSFAGAPYYRQGLLGFSNIDQRYEWITVDASNANMMIYQGEPGSGPRLPVSVKGVFTDQGWLGEHVVGKPVPMRTEIRIESNDRHVFDLFFTPPGGVETLVDRKVYTRVK